jgi:hypothetical protein
MSYKYDNYNILVRGTNQLLNLLIQLGIKEANTHFGHVNKSGFVLRFLHAQPLADVDQQMLTRTVSSIQLNYPKP